ncbi:MAG: hypothetical protein KC418_03110 [Anaerolineales bacterium]|nr:hypothetical protein [Anaerolineales bacterium]MCB8952621.1 hypothetical protein [Ardenticatenales bacterium]
MLVTIEGVYRDGKIELTGIPQNMQDETLVIVTFLTPRYVDLRTRGIDEDEAFDLRARLSAFAEDWESSEMNIYDHYDAAHTSLQAR